MNLQYPMKSTLPRRLVPNDVGTSGRTMEVKRRAAKLVCRGDGNVCRRSETRKEVTKSKKNTDGKDDMAPAGQILPFLLRTRRAART